MYISYSDIDYYKQFSETTENLLQTLSSLIGDGTYFVSHIDSQTFSIIKSLVKSDIMLEDGVRLPLSEAY